jgi:prolipoprotein diacylglyceryltransferase
MFRAHSTAENNSLAANSQILSIPMMLLGCIHWPYRDVG